jgi:hypothetical protein
MKEYVCIVGLDEEEALELCKAIEVPSFYRVTLPSIQLQSGQLWVETESRPRYVPVSKLVYHAIYENDLDFITGLAFWGGACLPNPRAMLDLRLKLPGLLRVLNHTRFGFPRDFVTSHTPFQPQHESVAKWGNWHCGENKERISELWSGDEAAVIEPFIHGSAVRVVMIGDRYWQIKLEGDNWLKSIHHSNANFMDVDPELLDDTRHIKDVFGLEIIANDYMVSDDGMRYLLEVNHIPNVTRFPEIWEAYRNYTLSWLNT